MPLFIVNARDKTDSLYLRMATRQAHLEWAVGFKDVSLSRPFCQPIDRQLDVRNCANGLRKPA